MAFGNYQNDKTKKLNISTDSFAFYSETSKLQLLFLGDALGFKLNPLLPESKRTEKQKYDYDTFIMTTVHAKALMDLYVPTKVLSKMIMEDPSVVNTFTSFGFPSGSNLTEISPATKVGGPEGQIALTIYNSIDDKGIPSQQLSFFFGVGSYITNYNPNDGSYGKSDMIQDDFLLFTVALEEAIKALTNATSHSIRNVSRYDNRFIKSAISALATKEGIDLSTTTNQYNKNTTNYFGNSAKNKNDEESQDVGRLTDGGLVESEGLPY